MKYKKFLRRVATLFVLAALVLAQGAEAVLNLTFSDPVKAGQIDLFWQGDATDPTLDGKEISGDPTATLSQGLPGKPDETPPSLMYIFWSGEIPAASQTNYFRVWDDTTKAYGSHYTKLSNGYSNSYGGLSEKGMTIDYTYIVADASKAIISSYDETGTVTLYPPPSSATKTVTFYSTQPKVGNYSVQVKETNWKINGNEESGSTSKKFTNITAGTTYEIMVQHKAYWGDWGDWSDPVTYTVGEMPEGIGGAVSMDCNFKKTPALGVNQFSLPMSSPIIFDGTTSISNLKELVDAVEAKGVTVNTVGWWNAEVQVPVGYVNKGGVWEQQNGAPADITTVTFERDKVYQMSVSNDVSFTLSGTR